MLLVLHSYCNAGVFENSVIKFTYPAKYKDTKIENAPHMIVKLESDDALISISRWDNNIGDDVDAWNDELYNNYNSVLSDLVLLEKVVLRTKNENFRALKTYINTNENGLDMGFISFTFIKGGDVYVASSLLPRTLTKTSSSKLTEEVLYGLEFKDKKENHQEYKTVEEFENAYIELMKEINKSLPVQVDEITTLFGAINIGKTLFYKYSVESWAVEFMDADWELQFKKQAMRNMMASHPNAEIFFSYMAKSSLQIIYLFYNEEGELIRRIKLTPNDFKL